MQSSKFAQRTTSDFFSFFVNFTIRIGSKILICVVFLEFNWEFVVLNVFNTTNNY